MQRYWCVTPPLLAERGITALHSPSSVIRLIHFLGRTCLHCSYCSAADAWAALIRAHATSTW